MSDVVDRLSRSQLLTLKGETVVLPSLSGGRSGAPKRYTDGTVIDQKYRIISLLGEGGMGAVYKVQHVLLGKEMALKTFRSPDLDDEYLKRFQREAQAIGSLNHPNIVQVFDYGVGENNLPYYTMEVLIGESLADRLARVDHLPLEQSVHIFVQACQALSVAHHKGIIHRDLKPANIFLERGTTGDYNFPHVKIVDFGLAGWTLQSVEGQKLTATGTIFGSPLYMSPEQSLGQELSGQADIYSCGCSIFETLTGLPPYYGENAFVTMLQHQSKPVPTLHSPRGESEFPDRLKGLVQKMLAKHPEKRIQSFDEVADELQYALAAARAPAASQADLPEDIDKQSRTEGTAGSPLVKIMAAIACLALAGAGCMYLLHQHTANPGKAADSVVARRSAPPAVIGLLTSPESETSKITLAPGQKYFQGASRKGPGWKRYVFLPVSLGHLQWGPGDMYYSKRDTPPPDLQARGAVDVAPHACLQLTVGPELVTYPDLFEGFASDDLKQIHLSTYARKWTDLHMSKISRLTGLRELSLDYTAITDKCLADLNKLPNLHMLSIRKTDLTGKALSTLKTLNQLDSLRVENISDISSVLQAMRNDCAIKALQVTDCNLSRPDIALISTMPNISELSLSANSQVDDTSFEILTKLNNLEELRLGLTSVKAKSIEQFKKFPKLKKLYIIKGAWTAEDKSRLRKILPECLLWEDKTVGGKEADAVVKDMEERGE